MKNLTALRLSRAGWLIALLPALLVTALPARAASSDAALAEAVKARVLQTAAFREPLVDLQVRAQDGAVNLSGWVHYASDDLLARQLAAAVPGVASVSSNFRSWSSGSR
jgi:osmotically-inducible protein OsmY